MVEITAMAQKKEKKSDNIKHNNTHIIGDLEGEEKGLEKIFEDIIAKNFPTMGKETVTQIQEVHRAPYRINPSRKTPRPTVIKLTKIKDKEKILKATNNIQGTLHKTIS